MTTPETNSAPYWAKIVSGSMGSLVTSLAVTPLEVVKVRQQSQIPSQVPTKVSLCPQGCGTFIFNTGHGARDNILPKSRVPFFDSSGKLKDRLVERGTVKLLRTIFRKEGVSGLYAGLGATLTMGVPNTVVYFVCYDELSSRLKSTNHSSSWELAGAGATARIIASSMTAPLELIKTIQASRIGAAEQASGMFAEFQSLIKSEGFHSLYKGLSPTLFRDVPFSACYWFSIEMLKETWRVNQQSERISAGQEGCQALINGMVSGFIASVLTQPMDVIKTRRQLQLDTEPLGKAASCNHSGALVYRQTREAGTLEIFQKIIAEEGPKGLWKGYVPRTLKVSPACAIMLGSYEIGKRMLSD